MAKPNARPTGPSMFALVGDMNGPTLWRVLSPITALERKGYPCGWDFQKSPAAQALAMRYDGIILPRMSWNAEYRRLAAAWFERTKALGKLVVFDADDDLFTIEYSRRHSSVYREDPRPFEQLEAERRDRIWSLQQCDGATVSTEHLAGIARSLTARPVVVVPNAIDLAWFRTASRRAARRTASVTIGWAGGRRDDADLQHVALAWSRIAESHPGVRFVVAGWHAPVLLSAVPHDRLVLVPWLALERYPEALVEIDVACCAVEYTAFNASKSNIKALEAAAAGSAVVATPTLYGDLIRHGESGYLASSADEWEAALQSLVESPALRRMMATRLLRTVEKRHSLDGNLHRWPAAWSEIAAAAGNA